jgi:hypothetical protein
MNSSNIIIGPGYKTWNSANFRFGEGGIKVKFLKNHREVTAEEFGRFDSVQTDRRVVTTGRLWSGWENLSSVFPSAAFNPTIGGKLFGTSNLNGVINGQDGSRLTTLNEQMTKVSNLELSVEKELFGADIEFTALLKAGNTPDQASSYYTESEGNAYVAPSFDKTKFRAPVVTYAWGAVTGFTSFAMRKGAMIDWKWDLDFEPCYVDGYGTMDAIITGFEGSLKGTPIGPTLLQAMTNLNFVQALGVLEGGNGSDLTATFGANSVTLYQAFLAQNDAFSWARKQNRIGDLTWRTTVPFSAGAPTARAAVA